MRFFFAALACIRSQFSHAHGFLFGWHVRHQLIKKNYKKSEAAVVSVCVSVLNTTPRDEYTPSTHTVSTTVLTEICSRNCLTIIFDAVFCTVDFTTSTPRVSIQHSKRESSRDLRELSRAAFLWLWRWWWWWRSQISPSAVFFYSNIRSRQIYFNHCTLAQFLSLVIYNFYLHIIILLFFFMVAFDNKIYVFVNFSQNVTLFARTHF